MPGMNWTISQLRLAWNYESEFLDGKNVGEQPLAGVAIDSRTVRSGELFVAISGDTFDGHAFVATALENGALAAVVSQKWAQANKKNDGNYIVVKDTLVALQKMASAYRKKVNPFVLGLTGTNGKTTTKEMLANVISTEKITHKTAGNLNNHIGVPLTLLAMREPVEVAIIEMGMNHAREITLLCEIAQPNAAMITNIGRGHTEFFGSLEGVKKAKQEIFDYIAPRGTACVNIDDENVVNAARDAGVQAMRTFGFSPRAAVNGTELHIEKNGCASFRWQDEKITLSVPGIHNGQNALAAICAGNMLGISKENIIKGVQQDIGVSGRMRILKIGGRTIIDDSYNANPESMLAAIATLVSSREQGRIFAALGDMLELGKLSEENHVMVLQNALKNKIDHVMIFGPEMKKAVTMLANKSLRHFSNKKSMAGEIFRMSRPGDFLLVKGSRGMQMEDVIAEFEKLASSNKSDS
ncbi:MAG: UDP-N-acetylmuramoyl-tripeptide--D-alanyl-D-alanine ligase [Calditrichaeota bacterium]|nr:MAG: UDP-N-acetylmuramoyl-tripeptide--D-alanyl-D-alanine ligase [Calditrichota bacterium]